MSILAEAIELQDIELVREAIAAGEDVNELAEGVTCLWGAVSYHTLQIAEMLLTAGADPNIRATETDTDFLEGTTPIYWAVQCNDMPMLGTLRSHGALTNVVSAMGATLLHDAADHGHSELMEWLLQTEAVECLEARDIFACTPLGVAADRGHVECARLLIEAGADVNAIHPDLCCRTPLTQAVDECHLDVVALLLAHGADPTLSGCLCHLCPLEEAKRWKRHPELLELLEDAANRGGSPPSPRPPPSRRSRPRQRQAVRRQPPFPSSRGS